MIIHTEFPDEHSRGLGAKMDRTWQHTVVKNATVSHCYLKKTPNLELTLVLVCICTC